MSEEHYREKSVKNLRFAASFPWPVFQSGYTLDHTNV